VTYVEKAKQRAREVRHPVQCADDFDGTVMEAAIDALRRAVMLLSEQGAMGRVARERLMAEIDGLVDIEGE
jgi:hypothetical protein